MSTSLTRYIEIRDNHVGQQRAYVAGTRVRVQDIYTLSEIQGSSPDDIVRALPHLTLAQVHAALAYYFDHRAEIVDEVRQEQELAASTRARTGPGPQERKIADAGPPSLSS